ETRRNIRRSTLDSGKAQCVVVVTITAIDRNRRLGLAVDDILNHLLRFSRTFDENNLRLSRTDRFVNEMRRGRRMMTHRKPIERIAEHGFGQRGNLGSQW